MVITQINFGRGAPAAFLLFVLSACAAPNGVDTRSGFFSELPEAVAEMADPSQDLTAVKLDPDDRCFWYRYDGPVETTMLPLRTRDGRPICARAKDE